MDSNCQDYVQNKSHLVTGTFKTGRGIDRSYKWKKIKSEYINHSESLSNIIDSEGNGQLENISEKTKWCAGHPNPPSDCQTFQAYCVNELKNKGLEDLLTAWNLRLKECLTNPNIIHKGKKEKYLDVYGENCEKKKVVRNVNGVFYIKKDFDKLGSKLPPKTRALLETLKNNFKEYESKQDLLSLARDKAISNESKEIKNAIIKDDIDMVLAQCKGHFGIDLTGASCDVDESDLIAPKEFTSQIQAITDLASAQRIVVDVADKDILGGVYGSLYLALISGDAKSRSPEDLMEALCPKGITLDRGRRTNTRNKRLRVKKENICFPEHSSKREELVQSFIKHGPKIEASSKEEINKIVKDEVRNINKTLKDIKPYCEKLDKNSTPLLVSKAKMFVKGAITPMTSINPLNIKDVIKTSKLETLKEEYTQGAFDIYQNQLIKNSKFPGIFATEALERLRIGETLDNCNIAPVAESDVRAAIVEAKKLSLGSVNENLAHKNHDLTKKNKNRLEDILRTDPKGVYGALLKNKDPSLAKYVCNMMKEQKEWDRRYAIGKGVAIGALVVASIIPGAVAITGPLAVGLSGASTALAIGLTGWELGEAGHEYLEGKSDEKAYMQKSVADGFFYFQDIDKAESKKDDAAVNAMTEIALEWGTWGVGKLLKAGVNTVQTNKVRKVVNSGGSDISKQDFKQLLKDGKSNVADYFSKGNLSLGTFNSLKKFSKNGKSARFVSLLTSKMSPSEVKHFMEELAGFKSADEFNAFAKSVVNKEITSNADFFTMMQRYKLNGGKLERLERKAVAQLEELTSRNKEVVIDNELRLTDSKGYRKLIEDVKSGEVLSMPTGESFKIKKVLSSDGASNQVFELEDGNVLRVFKANNRYSGSHGPSAYETGYRQLGDANLNIPKVVEADPNGLWIKVEKVEIDSEIGTFNQYLAKRKSLPKKKRKKADKAFLEFSESTAGYEKLDDFHTEQISFGKDGKWHYMDPGVVNTKWSGDVDDASNVFRSNRDYLSRRNNSLIQKAEQRIFDIRRGVQSSKGVKNTDELNLDNVTNAFSNVSKKNGIIVNNDLLNRHSKVAQENALNLPTKERGAFRSDTFSDQWKEVSLEDAISNIYGKNIELATMPTKTGKLLVFPKNRIAGEQYKELVIDMNGGYFRINQGKYIGEGNKMKFHRQGYRRYLDQNGNQIDMPASANRNSETQTEFKNQHAIQTHFKLK